MALLAPEIVCWISSRRPTLRCTALFPAYTNDTSLLADWAEQLPHTALRSCMLDNLDSAIVLWPSIGS